MTALQLLLDDNALTAALAALNVAQTIALTYLAATKAEDRAHRKALQRKEN